MFGSIISFVGQMYEPAKSIYNTISAVLAVMVAYKTVFFAIGFLFTRKFSPAKNIHKYGILIAARNEEKVIGNLLDSINKQDYPKKLIDVFVVADNCTDNTAEIAKKYGAKVYERFDEDHKTKGFALQFLLKNIKKDYGIESYDGYFIFDADNLLNKNYISKMNDAFDSGEKIITSYRNTKNFDENWIASTYAIHWLRSIRVNHRARSVLHLATNIQGTGFLFANEIVRNGWNYTGLTEDRALTADAVARGYQISYQDEAEFFDEQPISLKVALRQRLRWSKGHLQAFKETGGKLFVNVFFGGLFIKDKWGKTEKQTNILKRIIEGIRIRFASYDMLIQVTPLVLINIFRWLLVCVTIYGCYSFSNGISNLYIFSGSTIIAKILSFIFKKPNISIEPGMRALVVSVVIAIWSRILYRLGMYISNMAMAVYIFIIERKRINKMTLKNKILFTLTWPTFDIIGRYTTYVALFKKVTWKPIPHVSKITIDEVDTSNGVR